MQNTRLQLLLERAPITDEDRHNISRIFAVLSSERQSTIIADWDNYITRFTSIRDRLLEEEARRFLSGLTTVNILLDESLERNQEKQHQKDENRKRIREELQSTIAHHHISKNTPDEIV